jgi:hypothetical protein
MFHPHDRAFDQARVIHIRSAAPRKPARGEPCNGCGVCCLAAPCPLGMLLSRRTQGDCAVLAWDEVHELYRCGALSQAQQVLQQALPRWLNFLVRPLSVALSRLGRRWIAANLGCDSELDAKLVPDIVDNAATSTRDAHDRQTATFERL